MYRLVATGDDDHSPQGLHLEAGEQASGSLLPLVMPVLEQGNSQRRKQGQGNDYADAYTQHVGKLNCLWLP